MELEKKVKLSSLIITLGLGASICFHFILGSVFKLDYPFNTFLFHPHDRFMDFVWPYTISHNPYEIARPDFQNFPALYKLASIFTILEVNIALSLFLFIFTAGMLAINLSQLKPQKQPAHIFQIIALTFFTYPFVFAFDRANFEIIVFFLIFLFAISYQEHPLTSAFFLGLAAALKGFPAIMGVLLLADKRYKEALFSGGVAIAVTLASYISLPGGLLININQHMHNLALYNNLYAANNEGLPFGNSLLGGIKVLTAFFNPSILADSTPDSLMAGYTIFAVAALAGLSAYVIYSEKVFWKRIALLVCALNLLPPVSGDYKLLHLLIPFYFFLHESDQKSDDLAFVILFSLLFIPKTYWHLPIYPEVSIAVLLNPLLMLAVVFLIIARNRNGSISPVFTRKK